MKQFYPAGDALDARLDREEQQRSEYLRLYPTRWARFLHWLGIR